MWPAKFQNKTNGITPRRWLLLSNPSLADVICEKVGDCALIECLQIGDEWVTKLDKLTELKKFVDNKGFMDSVRRVKQENNAGLMKTFEIEVNPSSLFDMQVPLLSLSVIDSIR